MLKIIVYIHKNVHEVWYLNIYTSIYFELCLRYLYIYIKMYGRFDICVFKYLYILKYVEDICIYTNIRERWEV